MSKLPYKPFDIVSFRISDEAKAMLVKRAKEANESMGGYIRRYLIDPWYIHQIGQCSKVTVYFEGDAEIIRVEIDNVPGQDQGHISKTI